MLDRPPRSSEFIRIPHVYLFGQFCRVYRQKNNCMLLILKYKNLNNVAKNLNCNKGQKISKRNCSVLNSSKNNSQKIQITVRAPLYPAVCILFTHFLKFIYVL